jgi:dihydropteroate synthase
LHAVPPQRGRRAQQGHIGGRLDLGIERRPVSGESDQLTATAKGDGHDADDDDDGYGEQNDGHSMNRAMLGLMVLRALTPLPPGTALIAVADSLAGAAAAVLAGADVVDLAAAPAEVILAFRARHPGVLVVGAAAPGADLVRDAAQARATGALLICADTEAARRSGLPAGQLLMNALPAQLPAVIQAGLAALVDADHAADLAAAATEASAGTNPDTPDSTSSTGVSGIVAIAALSSWLGASAVRTRHPAPVRRALDMAASIRGTRPPAMTVRGLA